MNTRTFIIYLSAMLMCAAMGCAKDDATDAAKRLSGGNAFGGASSMFANGATKSTSSGTTKSTSSGTQETSGSTTNSSTSTQESCGSITGEGICQGSQLQYCTVNGTIHKEECGANGGTCAYVSEDSYYDCVQGQPGVSQPGNSGSTTLGSCSELQQCFEGCSADECYNSCYSKAGSLAQQQSDALWTCANQNQCTEFSCVEQACSTQLSTCYASDDGIIG